MRYRFKLTNFMSSEKNRLQNCLTVSNIQLGNVVSDTFGKSSMKIINKLLENPLDNSFDIEPLIHCSMKDKLPELELAIARMLLTAIYNILKKKEPYNAELYKKSDVLPVSREITIEQAILLVRTQGYRIRAAS